ncbi:hypothetical protein D3C81_2260530 [compost metagenome]
MVDAAVQVAAAQGDRDADGILGAGGRSRLSLRSIIDRRHIGKAQLGGVGQAAVADGVCGDR